MKSLSKASLAFVLLFVLGACAQSLSTARSGAPAEGGAVSGKEPSATVAHTPSGYSDAGGAEDIAESGPDVEEPGEQEKLQQSSLDEALELCQAAQEYWQKGELDNALEALDQAYSLILRVEPEDDPQAVQQKEDLRFMIAKRILEIYASRHIVVNGHYEAIPMVENRHVQAELESFTAGKEKEFFLAAYQRSGLYRPYIATQMIEAGLPEELSWLPLIESGFKPTALSTARALGLWQFIPSTGYKFGLNRDKFIDERLDPVKATKAAIDYLKELHQIFGDWTTVLAAYNCGEGRVLRVIRSQNINYLDNFWDLYERLPQETARYVPRFLATLQIVKNLEKYGLQNVPLDPPMAFEVYWVNKQISLSDIAKAIDVSPETLYQLNPELRYKILPPEDYPLKVPPEKCDLLASKLEDIPVCTPPKSAYVYHTIRRGETLSTIARKYGSSVKAVARANDMSPRKTIVAGKRLKIPSRGYAASSPPPPQRKSAEGGSFTTHVVVKGDSLWILAQRYGTTTRQIQDANRLRSPNLFIGQRLRIPSGAQGKESKAAFKTYRVKKKDSPYGIARLHNMNLERFLRINNLTPRSRIYPGQTLLVD